MNNTPWQSALREIQGLLASNRFWVGLIMATLILAVSGPFGTLEVLNFAERLVYWGVTAVLTFFCGLFFSVFVGLSLLRAGVPEWPSRIIAGLAAGIPVAAIVWFINEIAFRFELGGWSEFLEMTIHCMVISLAVQLLYFLMDGPGNSISTSSTFLERLPKHLGKNILHLTAQDHYVKAVTDRGSELILMRFSDALRELELVEGIQVHRAHWVAIEAVSKPIRKNGKLTIETIDGEQFPVSRTYSKSVREALNIN